MSSSRLDNLFGDPEDDPLLQEDSLGDRTSENGQPRQNGKSRQSERQHDGSSPPNAHADGKAGAQPDDAAEEDASSEADASDAEFGEWTSDVWSSLDEPGTSTAPGGEEDPRSEDAADADAEDPVDLPDLDTADPGATSDNPTASLTALLGKPRDGDAASDERPEAHPDERVVTVDADAAARGHLDPLRSALADGCTIRRVTLNADATRLQFTLQSPAE